MIRLDTANPSYVHTRSMHRIHWSTVVTLALGVILTLVVALQLLPAVTAAGPAEPARAIIRSSSFTDAGSLPLPMFIAGAMLAVLLTAAALWSAAARAGDRA